MADKIEVDYEEMDRLAKAFLSEAEALTNLLTQTRNKVSGLHGAGWVGVGSDAFFNETETVVLPGFDRLQKAITQTGERTQELVRLMSDAEEEASGAVDAE